MSDHFAADQADDGSILQFFDYNDPDGAGIGKLFYDLAHKLQRDLPSNSYSHTLMIKLLEARDCAFRAKAFR